MSWSNPGGKLPLPQTSPETNPNNEQAQVVSVPLPSPASASPGQSIELEVNGTPNGSQTKLNLVAGTDITVTDDGIGDVTIAGTGGFTAGEDLSGSNTMQEVIGIQGHLIDGGPTDGDVLKYSSGSGKWEPTPLGGTSGGVNVQSGGSYTAIAGDDGKLIVFNGGAATLSLPGSPPSATWKIGVVNLTTGFVTLPSGLDGISGSIILSPLEGTFIYTDGTTYYTERGIKSGGIIDVRPQNTTVQITSVAANTPSAGLATYSYTLTSGPGPEVGETIVLSNCTSGGNNGTFDIASLGPNTIVVANASAVTEAEGGSAQGVITASASNASYTVGVNDKGKLVLIGVNTGFTAKVVLPITSPPSTWWIAIKNTGKVNVQIAPVSSGLIDELAPPFNLVPGLGCFIYTAGITDGSGSHYWTVTAPLMIGDSGTGGFAGLCGAPGTGDAAAGKFWKADGSWQVPVGSGGVNAQTGNYTALSGDSGKLVTFNITSDATLKLPDPSPGATWWLAVENTGAATLSVDPNGLTLDGSTTVIRLSQNQGCLIYSDGTKYFTSRGKTPVLVTFYVMNGAAGSNVGPELLAPRAGNFTKCVVVTRSSDASVGLQFRIRQNGTDVFSSDPTVAAGTAEGTKSTFTALTSTPLPVAAADVFKIDILSGTQNWSFTAQLQ